MFRTVVLSLYVGLLIVPATLRSQQFYNIAATNGSGAVLDVYGNGTADGTPVDIATPNGTTAQLWQLVPLDNGNYQIVTGNGSGAVLDVFGNGTADGTPVDIASPNGTTAQLWQLVPLNDGNYQIVTGNGSGAV